MKWARIEDGIVRELTDIDPEGRFVPEYIWVECSEDVQNGWAYIDGAFAPYVPPPLTDEQVSWNNTISLQQKNQLAAAQKTALTNRVGTLQDAVDLEMATSDEIAELPERQAQLLTWKKYAIFLGRLPAHPGWPLTVTWPDEPPAGMDLSISFVAPQAS